MTGIDAIAALAVMKTMNPRRSIMAWRTNKPRNRESLHGDIIAYTRAAQTLSQPLYNIARHRFVVRPRRVELTLVKEARITPGHGSPQRHEGQIADA